MKNTYEMEWMYLNLVDNQTPVTDFSVKGVSLPEITAIKDYLGMSTETEKVETTPLDTLFVDSEKRGSKTSVMLEALPYVIILGTFIAASVMGIIFIGRQAEEGERVKIKPMQFEDEEESESEMRNLRTRESYLK